MKVACIGNMNNNFFTLVRYLRDKGIDAHLLLRNNEFSHFLPEADTYCSQYNHVIHQLKWGHVLTYYTTSARTIRKDLEEYDFIICCGTVPAFMDKCRRRIDLLIPYGADIYGFPYCRFPYYIPLFFSFANAQKRALKSARNYLIEKSGNLLEEAIKQINFSGKRLPIGLPLLYVDEYNPESISKHYDTSSYYPQFRKIREKYDIMIFHQTRLQWKTSPDELTWKANDKLIVGFANFLKKHKSAVNLAALIILEYGTDIEATKDLIKELEIEEFVYWFPKMMRKELMIGLSLADIGTAEFHNSWICSGVIYESLALAKPLMQYRDDDLEIYKENYTELYPIMNINSASDVTSMLDNYLSNKDHYKKIGEKGREWHLKYIIEKPIKEIIQLIKTADTDSMI